MASSFSSNASRLQVKLPSESMEFTDWMALVAITMAIFWAVDPFTIQLWRPAATRHIPTAMALISISLCITGRMLFQQNAEPQLRAVLVVYRELIFFASFVIVGSLYAKFALGIDNTFLSMGVFLILGGPVNLWIIRTSRAPTTLIRNISIVFVVIAISAVVENALQFGKLIFHSLEHVVLVPVALALFASRNSSLRLISVGLVILGAVAQNKFTGYIVLLIVFGWVFVDELMNWTAKEADPVRAGLNRILGIFLALFAAVIVVAVYEATKTHLPDGNTVYRMHTYEKAFNRFLDSWIWGRGFTAPAVDFFDLFVVNTSTQFLPTHSDPLDILANGGLLAAIPFSVGLFSIIYSGWKALSSNWSMRQPKQDMARAQLVMYFLCLVSGITVMAFNPVLNTTTLAYIYWTCSAVMLALARTVSTDNAITLSSQEHRKA